MDTTVAPGVGGDAGDMFRAQVAVDILALRPLQDLTPQGVLRTPSSVARGLLVFQKLFREKEGMGAGENVSQPAPVIVVEVLGFDLRHSERKEWITTYGGQKRLPHTAHPTHAPTRPASAWETATATTPL